MKHEIKLYSYITDGGDGGGNTSVYGSMEDLKADNFAVDEWTTEEEQEEKFQSALAGDNPYEDGEIDEDTLIIEEVDGKLKMTGSLNFHWGQ